MRSSLGCLDLAPDRVTVPLFLAAYRAPLGAYDPVDFSVFVVGRTGSQKSELTAMAQAHFGARFSGKNLPASWESTGNSLERKAFLAKDALFTVDDYVPKGTASDVAKLQKDADRLLRGAGNRTGRGRMGPDGSLRPTYFPRSLVLSSGEDVPRGESLGARLIVIDVERGMVDLGRLTRVQDDAAAGQLAGAMSAYIRWLAQKPIEYRRGLLDRRSQIRADLRKLGLVAHDRAPDNAASLLLAGEVFLDFARDCGALTETVADGLWERFSGGVIEAAERHALTQSTETDIARFVRLISTALLSGKAHLVRQSDGTAPKDAVAWGWRVTGSSFGGQDLSSSHAQGDRIGWVSEDGQTALLDSDATYAVVQRVAREQGLTFGVGASTVWTRLREVGVLAASDQGQSAVKRKVAGYTSPKRVMCVLAEIVLSGELPDADKG